MNIYLSLVSKQLYLSQMIDIIVISFLFWALYDNPLYFVNMKKNDDKKAKKRIKKIKLEIEKNKLYKDKFNYYL
jgi:hypothetical protein